MGNEFSDHVTEAQNYLYTQHSKLRACSMGPELLVGEIDPDAARPTHVRRRPGEHEWDTIADRRPGLYERLLRTGMDREHPPTAAHYSGDVE